MPERVSIGTGLAIFVFLLLGAHLAVAYEQPKDYAGYKSLQVTLKDLSRGDQTLQAIRSNTNCIEQNDLVIPERPISFLCDDKDSKKLAKWGRRHKGLLKVKVAIGDVGSSIREEKVQKLSDARSNVDMANFNHSSYLDFGSIQKFLIARGTSNYHVKLDIAGRSFEGRPIYVLNINGRNKSLPIIIIESGTHAREWIATACVLFLIDKLINATAALSPELESEPESIFRRFRYKVIPLLNPDGYQYTHTTDRFWSKNRRPVIHDTDCIGVNLNRNFPSGFGNGPNDSCARGYIGPKAGSEPETRALMNYVKRHCANNTILALALHSFGQVFFLPYAYGDNLSNSRHPNLEKMKVLAEDSSFYILPHYYQTGLVKNFTRYNDGGIGGTSMDYYADLGIPYSYTMELPDYGEYGMLLPANEIKTIGHGVFVGLEKMLPVLYDESKLLLNIPETGDESTEPSTTSPSIEESTTTHPDEKRCCSKFLLVSSGASLVALKDVIGTYEVVPGLTHFMHFTYKRISPPTIYMYYMPQGYWFFGQYLYHSLGYLAHLGAANCPEDLPDGWYFYEDGKWYNDNNGIKLFCI